MRRWRTIARIGVPIRNGQTICTIDESKFSRLSVPLWISGEQKGEFLVAVDGDRIRALLPWRYRSAFPVVDGRLEIDWFGDICELRWYDAFVNFLLPADFGKSV